MSYRDDNDAAFERADALQYEVDRREETIAALRRRLDASETERARLAELAHEVAPFDDKPPVVAKDVTWSAESIMILYAVVIVAMFAIVIAAASAHR